MTSESPGEKVSLDSYLDSDQHNLDEIRAKLPHYRELMPRIHALYDRAHALTPRDADRVFGRCMLLCHKCFLSAAAAIGRRHPDDAAAATRRAIETATLAIAYKLDPKNFERWEQAEARLKRWEKRHEGERPGRISVQYSDAVREHQLVQKLKRHEGTLSDAFVHFTPESVIMHAFQEITEGNTTTIELPFIERDLKIIEQQLIHLTEIHTFILAIFDECYDGRLPRDPEWQQISRELFHAVSAASAHYERVHLRNEENNR
jgi:hypothetical protein